MNFSEPFRQSAELCKFSPDGKFLASGVDYRLVVRDVDTLQIQQLFSCLDAIQHIEWSNDSQFILCGMYKRGMVQVWSLEIPDWHCKIDEGSAGLAAVRWSPDGRHILTTADFHLRITIWSLVTKSVSYIRYPKQCVKGLDFSKNGKYMALAERRDCKDHISIFSCQSWTLVRHFECDTSDLAGVEWSSDSRFLSVWDSCLEFKVIQYAMDGRRLSSFQLSEYGLGIKTVRWSPSGQFLAIGSYDQKVRLLNHITWKTIKEFSHPDVIEESSNVVVYRESQTRTPNAPPGISSAPTVSLFNAQSKYEVEQLPVKVPEAKPNLNKANPKVGVGSVSFSHDNRWMSTRNDNMPCALWIWNVQQLSLAALLIQSNPIKHIQWDPCHSRLALCTSTNKVYMWSPDGSLSVEVPVEGTFVVHNLAWHPDGEAILLIGKDQMCVCFLSPSDSNLAAAHNSSTINTQDGREQSSNDYSSSSKVKLHQSSHEDGS